MLIQRRTIFRLFPPLFPLFSVIFRSRNTGVCTPVPSSPPPPPPFLLLLRSPFTRHELFFVFVFRSHFVIYSYGPLIFGLMSDDVLNFEFKVCTEISNDLVLH